MSVARNAAPPAAAAAGRAQPAVAPSEGRGRTGQTDPGALAGLAEAVLGSGGSVCFVARGSSMAPSLLDGDVVRVEPVRPADVRLGDALLYRDTGGRAVLHRVVGPLWPRGAGRRLLGGAAGAGFQVRGDALPWSGERVPSGRVLGRMAAFEREGREHEAPVGGGRINVLCRVWAVGLWARLRSRARAIAPRGVH